MCENYSIITIYKQISSGIACWIVPKTVFLAFVFVFSTVLFKIYLSLCENNSLITFCQQIGPWIAPKQLAFDTYLLSENISSCSLKKKQPPTKGNIHNLILRNSENVLLCYCSLIGWSLLVLFSYTLHCFLTVRPKRWSCRKLSSVRGTLNSSRTLGKCEQYMV